MIQSINSRISAGLCPPDSGTVRFFRAVRIYNPTISLFFTMDLKEIFRDKNIVLETRGPTFTTFMAGKLASEIIPSLKGDVFYVRSRIPRAECNGILRSTGTWIIKTHPVSSYDDFNVNKTLEGAPHVTIRRQDYIGINFLHNDNTLYILPDADPSPNERKEAMLIKIAPVRRHDVDLFINVDMDAIPGRDGRDESPSGEEEKQK